MKLDEEVVERLTPDGILAYVAVAMVGRGTATTAALANLVRLNSNKMLEGLKELTTVAPELAHRKEDKWQCEVIKSGTGIVEERNLDSERYRSLVDDLKKFWDYLNPELPFEMGGKEGAAIRGFLNNHRHWTEEIWRGALKNRIISIKTYGAASRSEPIWVWIGRLDLFAGGCINQYGKPVGGTNGKAESIANGNREAVERAIANAGAGANGAGR